MDIGDTLGRTFRPAGVGAVICNLHFSPPVARVTDARLPCDKGRWDVDTQNAVGGAMFAIFAGIRATRDQ